MAHDEDTRWIAERAKCDMRTFLREVQCLVKQNVVAMNAECDKRGWTRFEYTPFKEHPLTFYIEPKENPSHRRCTFTYQVEHQQIGVTMLEPDRTYQIRTRWDPETWQCQVVVERPSGNEEDTIEFPHQALEKVVSSVLEPFFFLAE